MHRQFVQRNPMARIT